jgi:hypothetical protein
LQDVDAILRPRLLIAVRHRRYRNDGDLLLGVLLALALLLLQVKQLLGDRDDFLIDRIFLLLKSIH